MDITQNDGIYSAVFPYVSSLGFYAVQVIADDNNGEAVIPKDENSIQIGNLFKQDWIHFFEKSKRANVFLFTYTFLLIFDRCLHLPLNIVT